MRLGTSASRRRDRPGDVTRVCLSTAAGAGAVALCGALHNFLYDGHFAALGMLYVGLFYLALGLASWIAQVCRPARPRVTLHEFDRLLASRETLRLRRQSRSIVQRKSL